MPNTGSDIYDFIKILWPINRSLTGNGVRETLLEIKKILPNLKIHEVPSGKHCYDWEVPNEWGVTEAWIKAPSGEIIVDYDKNNLHLVGYSNQTNTTLSLDELKKHLFVHEKIPDAIPYVTAYYGNTWGFCVTKQFKDSLRQGQYTVKIDAKKFKGSMTYGELLIPGESSEEILFSTYVCHPSLANNELSGPALCTYLAKKVQDLSRRNKTYRFLFMPETIGAIYYLSKNLNYLKKRLNAGFVVTCVGDENGYSYMPSKYGNTYADKIALHVLKNYVKRFTSYNYLQRGSDERQYCSPGVDLPVCSVMKTKYGEYAEYHNSLDNLDFISIKGLGDAFSLYLKIIETIESDLFLLSKIKCEPMLGKRGLYNNLGEGKRYESAELLLNIHAYSDGRNSLLDIAEIIKKPIWDIYGAAQILIKEGIVKSVSKDSSNLTMRIKSNFLKFIK